MFECEYCNKKLKTQLTLNKHILNNKTCLKLRSKVLPKNKDKEPEIIDEKVDNNQELPIDETTEEKEEKESFVKLTSLANEACASREQCKKNECICKMLEFIQNFTILLKYKQDEIRQLKDIIILLSRRQGHNTE